VELHVLVVETGVIEVHGAERADGQGDRRVGVVGGRVGGGVAVRAATAGGEQDGGECRSQRRLALGGVDQQ
jgi:hypothetical protein